MTRDGAAAARMAHNHEVPGSSPGPATKKKAPPKGEVFFLVLAKPRFLDQPAQAGVSPRFGGARTRAGVYSEHAAAEKGADRCPGLATDESYRLRLALKLVSFLFLFYTTSVSPGSSPGGSLEPDSQNPHANW
jgi:hypothetical protein